MILPITKRKPKAKDPKSNNIILKTFENFSTIIIFRQVTGNFPKVMSKRTALPYFFYLAKNKNYVEKQHFGNHRRHASY
jgi:hypothetical protein